MNKTVYLASSNDARPTLHEVYKSHKPLRNGKN